MTDAELVQKYATRAPRYTSYPAAPHFREIDPEAVHAALACGEGPIALYVHVLFCKKLCLYCGCHVEIRPDTSLAAPYVDRLLAEARLWRQHLRGERPLAQLSLGGGTPTYLPRADMVRLLGGLREVFGIAPGAEIAIEIDPRSVDSAYLDTLVDLGVNRCSFGVQDVDEEVLQSVGRAQPAALTESALATLRSRGVTALNLDVMYGLPRQEPARFRATCQQVAAWRPTRIALFPYAHVPWMKRAQKALESRGLPGIDARSAMFAAACEVFGAAGYERIGMDHFALRGDPLLAARANGTLQRNFEGYNTGGGLDLLGIGASAIGDFAGVYAQDHKERAAWEGKIDAGVLPTERGFVLSEDDRLRRRVIMDLACNGAARFSGPEAAELGPSLSSLAGMVDDGLVEIQPTSLRVTDRGLPFVRNACVAFDRYYEGAGAPRYSSTA